MMRTTSPATTFSPSSGITKSATGPSSVGPNFSSAVVGPTEVGPYENLLRSSRIRLLGVDPEIGDRLLHHLRLQLAIAHERRQRRDDDEAGVHFEVIAEIGARFAAAEPVGAERDERSRQPAIDRVRQRLEVVGRRDED